MTRALSREGIAVPVEALAPVELFAGLDAGDLVVVASSMRLRPFDAGAVLFREGEPGSTMHVVLDGLVNELSSAPMPPQARSRSFFAEGRLVAKHRRGDAVGVMALLTGEPHASTARAAVPTTALELADREFRELIARFPTILSNLVRILGARLSAANVRYARRPSRGEAVALVTGPELERSVPEVLSAARAASPRSLEWLDARVLPDDVLAGLDGALHEHSRVVVLADVGDPALPGILEQMDRAVAVVADADARRLAVQMGTVAASDIEIVLVGANSGGGRARQVAATGLPVVRSLALGAGGDLSGDDVAWLGRALSRTRLGLALGAGGAKGYAHVGALYVLEREGYTVDCVAGSSIGAIVGSCVAQGMRAAEVEGALRHAFDEATVAQMFKLSLAGGSTGIEAMTRALRDTTGERSFDDLLIPLAVMTADLTDRRPAPIREGPLMEALLAATALAGLFAPHERDGHRLVDGLALVPVPTEAAIEDGADVTVAINIMGRETLPAWPGEHEASEPAPARPGLRTLETLLEVMELAQEDSSARNAGLADVVLTPRFGPGSWRDFHLADRFLSAGMQEAEQQLTALRSLACPQLHLTGNQGEDHGGADLRVR